jgi:predicted dehydrogenase
MARLVRWGLLGAGLVSRQFALCLRLLPDTRVVAVASRTRAHAEGLAQELGARASADYEALFADPEVDVVYIATPPGLHAAHALRAIARGKAVLCEKPFADSARAARDIVGAARERRVFCMEAMWMRFMPVIEQLKLRLARGDIGQVRMLQAELGFAIPERPGSRYYDSALGGGALLDLGVYPLSLAYHLLGPPSAAALFETPAASGVDAQVVLTLKYPGALASLSASFANRARNNAFVLGSAGQIELSPPLYAPTEMLITRTRPEAAPRRGGGGLGPLLERSPRWVELRRRLTPVIKPIVRRNHERVVCNFPGFGYQFEAAEVLRCLRAGELESPHMPLDESVAILALIERLRHARA